MEAQPSVEVLRSLGGECAKEDSVAASCTQAVGEGGDHGCADAPPPRGLQREQILNHAGAVRRGGVSAIGNRKTLPHSEMEMKGTALGSIAGYYARADFGRHFKVIVAPAFGMVDEDELEQRIPIRALPATGHNSDRWAALGKVASQSHMDRYGQLLKIVEREAEAEKRRQA